ncbi:MAG TPA: methyltransferase domain-containing protein [Rhizomicrobium sp.]|nr:methyltransferase domain-containing protein [Rhizomicrobium sp.]
MIPQIFDRRTYAMRRARGGESFLVREAAMGLADRLAPVTRHFQNALDLSSRDESFEILKPFAANWTRTFLSGGVIIADEEALPFPPETFDLVTSVLSLHAVNDLPGALVQIRRALKPDGLFLAALFGGETLNELRTAFAAGESDVTGGISPRVSPFADVRALGALLQRAGFALPVADSERTSVRYGKFETLVADLRALGETNALTERRRVPLSRAVLAATLAHYSGADGKFPATFDIVYLTGWAPHESQQKPLAPGSARTRLADALGTVEKSAGEKVKEE